MEAEAYLLTEQPAVLHNAMVNWPSSSWTPEFLSQQLPQPLSCKVTPLSVGKALMESECIQESVNLSSFVQWLRGQVDRDNPLHKYDRNTFSCYLDYKYMQEMFTTKPELLKAVCWESVGLEGRDGEASTLWMGSEGAYTNCHYDAYGYNLVAQIFGRKRWVLFPPSDTQHLYPTRIPFEESSIFSQVDIKHPDLKLHPKFKLTSVYEVILEPGQILYVPRHWWHYVECLEPAISVNTWVELTVDSESRFEEAITRSLFSSLWCSHIDMKKQDTDELGAVEALQEEASTQEWINPKEEIWDHRHNTFVLGEAFKAIEVDTAGGDSCPKSERVCGTSDISHSTTCNRERNLEIFARHFRGKTVMFPPKGPVRSVAQNEDKSSKPIQGEDPNISSDSSSETENKHNEKRHIEDTLSEQTDHQQTQKITANSTEVYLKRKRSEVYSDQLCTAKVSKLSSSSSDMVLTDPVTIKMISSLDTKCSSRNLTLNKPCDTLPETCLQCNKNDCDGTESLTPTITPSQSEISLTAVTPQPFRTWHTVCTCGHQNSDKSVPVSSDKNGSMPTHNNQIRNVTVEDNSSDNKLGTDNEVFRYQTCPYCVCCSSTCETVNAKRTLTFEEFVKCATHPDVIRTIAKVIRKNMAGD